MVAHLALYLLLTWGPCAVQARAFYSFQSFAETVHSEMYSVLLETFVRQVELRLWQLLPVSMSVRQRQQGWSCEGIVIVQALKISDATH
jgi:hypothetical protein